MVAQSACPILSGIFSIPTIILGSRLSSIKDHPFCFFAKNAPRLSKSRGRREKFPGGALRGWIAHGIVSSFPIVSQSCDMAGVGDCAGII